MGRFASIVGMRAKKRFVAWGTGTLLHNYLQMRRAENALEYVVDSFQESESTCEGLPFYPLSRLRREDFSEVLVVLFCVSGNGYKAITKTLNSWGLEYGTNYIDCSELFKPAFIEMSLALFGSADPANHGLSLSHYNNSLVSPQTTVCGCWTLLEALRATSHLPGPIVEVGAYRGGNSLLMSQALSFAKDNRKFFVMDSFSGFPEMSAQDPRSAQGAFNEDYSMCEIRDRFSMFPQVKVVQGFVPDTFSLLPQDQPFSLVFYDCDLYQPALDTLGFFETRLARGGYLVVHDYHSKDYSGVKKAVDEYSAASGWKPVSFLGSTMAVFQKK